MPNKKLAAVTVMYGKSGSNPQAGDHFWLKYTPDGKIEAEGKAVSSPPFSGKYFRLRS